MLATIFLTIIREDTLSSLVDYCQEPLLNVVSAL